VAMGPHRRISLQPNDTTLAHNQSRKSTCYHSSMCENLSSSRNKQFEDVSLSFGASVMARGELRCARTEPLSYSGGAVMIHRRACLQHRTTRPVHNIKGHNTDMQSTIVVLLPKTCPCLPKKLAEARLSHHLQTSGNL
jgi:hypothetical protein